MSKALLLYPEQYWRDGNGNIIKRWCEAPILQSGKISKKIREYWSQYDTHFHEPQWVMLTRWWGPIDTLLDVVVNFLCYRMSEAEAMEWYESVKLSHLTITGNVLEPPRYQESEEQ